MDPFWYVVIAIVTLSIVCSLLGVWREGRRTKAWQEVAKQPGMEFVGDRNDVMCRFGHMRLLQVGSSRKVYNAVSVAAGDIRVIIGDFRYRTGSGKNRTTHRRTVCVLESDAMSVPHCYLRPERKLLDALGTMLGGQDIDFAEDPKFSGAYVLQGDEEKSVRELFDADLRAWFAERKDRAFHFEAQGSALVFHTGRRIAPQQAPEHMDQALQIMKLLAGQRQ